MKPAPLTRPSLDSVTTIRDDGSRRFLHPSEAKGRFTLTRRWSGWLLVAIYLALPWIPVRGHPAVFLDVAGRRFHLFGVTLAFQDAWLMFFAISGLGFALFFVTALLGRVWCGWACPQTVFLDHVYRRVESWLEGDSFARRRLDEQPWTVSKSVRRGGKQIVFFALSMVIAHLFLAYFVSIPELWTMMSAAPAAHWASFLFVFVSSGILYFNFAWFREQLCIVICPYGRLQSVLIDDHSLVIGYDAKRGEPRTKIRAREKTASCGGAGDLVGDSGAAGACIDCNRCVQVCPTGIDIRQGLQIECIGCAACIDACDTVMDKIKRPRGLVRYDSLAGFAGRKTRWLRPRTLVYGALMAAGMAVASWAISTVRPANLAVTRMTGAPYFVTTDAVRNQFLVRLVNKSDAPRRFAISLVDAPAGLVQAGVNSVIELAPLAEEVRPLVLQMSRVNYAGSFGLKVRVTDEAGTFSMEREFKFIGPDAELLKEDQK